jgi:hypothetical protein
MKGYAIGIYVSRPRNRPSSAYFWRAISGRATTVSAEKYREESPISQWICDPESSVSRDEDVVRFDIAMHFKCGVEVCQRAGQLSSDVLELVVSEASRVFRKFSALKVWHNVVRGLGS